MDERVRLSLASIQDQLTSGRNQRGIIVAGVITAPTRAVGRYYGDGQGICVERNTVVTATRINHAPGASRRLNGLLLSLVQSEPIPEHAGQLFGETSEGFMIGRLHCFETIDTSNQTPKAPQPATGWVTPETLRHARAKTKPLYSTTNILVYPCAALAWIVAGYLEVKALGRINQKGELERLLRVIPRERVIERGGRYSYHFPEDVLATQQIQAAFEKMLSLGI